MAYSHYIKITIDPTKVGGSDLTNFTFPFSGTYADLATIANGGKLAHGSGFDMAPYSDVGLTTALKFQRSKWNAVSGQTTLHIKAPSVSASVATDIYLGIGDASVSVDPQDAANAFDTSDKYVFLLDDNAASTAVVNSRGLGNGVSGVNTDTRDIAGKIDGGLSVDGSGTDLITVADSAQWDMGTGFDLEFWFKTSLSGKNVIGNFNGANTLGYFWYFDNQWYVGDGSGWKNVATGFQTDGAFHLYALRWDGSNLFSYRNGVQVGTVAMASAGEPNRAFQMGSEGNSSIPTTGEFDFVRYAQSSRSAGWVLANYNAQNSPSTFYSVGSTTPTTPDEPNVATLGLFDPELRIDGWF